jgi:glycosyltransferase involved in cell wall biosynthesis
MRFAFISTMHGWAWGGSEELWSQTATKLRSQGHIVRASVGYWPQLSPKMMALADHGISLEIHSSEQAGPLLGVWHKVSGLDEKCHQRLIEFKPDLAIISQGHNSGGFEWAKVCRDAAIPYVILVQCNSEIWSLQEQLNTAKASYLGALRVLCVSRKNLDLLCEQLGEPLPNAELIRNSFNVSPDRPSPWPSEDGILKLACVARIDPPAKGQDMLLEVMAMPQWRERPVELNFFGKGPVEWQLHRTAKKLRLKNVFFRGHAPEVEEIWKKNHMLVLPSRYEGLPLALVESMWCARPSVVTDAGGNAELCQDGVTGFVAPVVATDDLGRAMERAWQKRLDWEAMGQAARTRVETLIPKNPVDAFCELLKSFASLNQANCGVEVWVSDTERLRFQA